MYSFTFKFLGILISTLYYMGFLPVTKTWEHIAIEYEGGEVVLRFREFRQTLKLFKKVERYGENKVVVSSSGWYESEQVVERDVPKFFLMMRSGAMLCIGTPRCDNEYGDDSVVLKIVNREGED